MGLPSIDPLNVRNVKWGILDPWMGSMYQRGVVMALAEDVRRRYLSFVPVESGELASSARVSAVRSRNVDRRWYADFEVTADHAAAVEERDHPLAQALRSMGWAVGDIVNGPAGFVPRGQNAPEWGR